MVDQDNKIQIVRTSIERATRPFPDHGKTHQTEKDNKKLCMSRYAHQHTHKKKRDKYYGKVSEFEELHGCFAEWESNANSDIKENQTIQQLDW